MNRHLTYALAVLPVIILGAALALIPIAAVERLREVVFDTYERIAPRPYDPDAPVRIVAIDEASLAKVGQWPWSRDVLARLTQRLAEAGAAVIAFDVVFGEPDQSSPDLLVRRLPDSAERRALEAVIVNAGPSHDELFAATIKQTPAVLGFVGADGGVALQAKAGFAYAGDDPRPFLPTFKGAILPIKALTEAAPGLGAVNWIPDGDSVVRKVPTVVVAGGALGPSLAMEALRVAQGASTIVIRSSNASGETAFGERTGVNAVKIGAVDIATDASGEIRLWARPAEPASWVSAASVLDGSFDQKLVDGRIVFVGAVAVGLGDRRTTPVEESIPGVEVHVQTIEQVLAKVSLTRPDWMPGLEALAILAGGALVAAFMRAFRSRPSLTTLASLALPAAIATASWFLFRDTGLLVDPLVPSLALLAVILVATAFHFGEAETRRAEVRGIFGRFVTPAVVEKLVEAPNRIVLGGELRPLTILFSDVRNFTSLSEARSPEAVVSLVRSIHTPATAAVLAHGGTIDKYIGDGMMAFWNAPLEDRDHAANACRAALAIIEATAAMTDPPIRLGVGVHTGEACVGNLGSEQRLEYSALGDAVNISSRVEGLTKEYGVEIVVSDTTAQAAKGMAFLELDSVRVKGRRGITTLFALDATERDARFERLAAAHGAMLAAYRAGRKEEAALALERAEPAYGRRYVGLFRLYRTRIEAMPEIAQEGWDGVTTLDHK